MSTFTWEVKWSQTSMRFLSVENLSQLFNCVHMNWGKTKLKPVWVSYRTFSNWHEIFMWTKFTWSKMNHLILHLMHMCVWDSLWVLFHCSHFDRNKISFQVIKYHLNTTQNEIPMHVHQNIRSFWNAAKMKHEQDLFSHQFEISN